MDVLQIKAAVRARDGNCCVECKMTSAESVGQYGCDLDVHRLTPGSPYTLAGCVTLCRACHGPKPRRERGYGPTLVIPRGDIKEAVRRYARKERRSMTQATILLLEEALQAEGLWPPPPPAEPES